MDSGIALRAPRNDKTYDVSFAPAIRMSLAI